MTVPETLTEIFFASIDRYGDRPVVMRAKVSGAWQAMSYQDLRERVEALTIGLRTLGVQPGDRVGLLSENRPEWAITDYACLCARTADVPVYPTLPPKQIAYILRDSGAVAIAVSNRAQLEKVLEIRDELPGLRHVIAFDADATGPGVLAFEELLQRGRAARAQYPAWKQDALAVRPDDLATLIYTSGTTGDPKGVMLTHGNITSNVIAGLEALPLRDSDECLSFLPLSHIFERMAGHYCMLYGGVLVNYATSVETVSAEMNERRPTAMLSVPRLYEKIYARVLEGVMAGSAAKKRIFYWAKRAAERWAELTIAGERIPGSLALQKRIADRLVFSKLRAKTGGRLRFFVSGGAPLSPEIAKFFYAAGLPILEGYGLTETSPVIAVNTFDHMRLGTVGLPVRGVEVKIAADGEVLCRGPNVMQGYYNRPEATAEALDAEGWFHTGDIGALDEDGYLRITDRKKDLIVTAGGKNIAPQPIENLVKTNPMVVNAVMIGDKRKFPIMLVVPNLDSLHGWAADRGLPAGDPAALLAHPDVLAKMESEVKKCLRDLAQFEMPKKLLLVERDFSVETGEMTPTMKVKRRVVERNYQAQIDALYAEGRGGAHDVDGRA